MAVCRCNFYITQAWREIALLRHASLTRFILMEEVQGQTIFKTKRNYTRPMSAAEAVTMLAAALYFFRLEAPSFQQCFFFSFPFSKPGRRRHREMFCTP